MSLAPLIVSETALRPVQLKMSEAIRRVDDKAKDTEPDNLREGDNVERHRQLDPIQRLGL